MVERLSFPNKGILTVEDSRMVVKNTIPGQVIEAVVTKNGSNRMEGRLQRVVTPSRWRQRVPVPITESAEAALTRRSPMRSS